MQETIFISLPLSQLQGLITDCLNRCLDLRKNQTNPSDTEDKWFNVIELCAYHPNKPAKATIYYYVAKNLIPYHKSTKNLRFLKSEIDAWLKEGKKKTASDIEAEADEFLSSRKRKEVRHA